MQTQSWTLDVDGAQRVVTVDEDPQSGKVMIRVDGRMGARPMAPDEEERDVRVGSATYVVRRLAKGGFDLDIAPPDFTQPNVPKWTAPGMKVRKEVQPDSGLKKKIWGAAVSVVVFGLLAWGWDTLSYWRVDWKPYYGEKGAFKVSFPEEPEKHEETITSGGGTMKLTSYSSNYRRHWYYFGYSDLPGFVPIEHVDGVLNAALDNMIRREGAELVARQSGYVARHDAVHFIAQFPGNARHPAGAVRGHLVLFRGQRLYIQFVVVPKRHSTAFDVGEYLRSIQLPEPSPDPRVP